MSVQTARPRLYTFLFDFNGGTYISQVEAAHPAEAKRRWALHLKSEGIEGVREFLYQGFVDDVESKSIVAVTDQINVWGFSVLLRNKLGLIHVVETSRDHL